MRTHRIPATEVPTFCKTVGDLLEHFGEPRKSHYTIWHDHKTDEIVVLVDDRLVQHG